MSLGYINLNILECKFILSCCTSSILPDINLNILECKSLTDIKTQISEVKY